jgi:hypothetical protein
MMASRSSGLRAARAYRYIFVRVREVDPALHIVFHLYGHPVPDGRGAGVLFVKMAGPWLRPHLAKKGIESLSSRGVTWRRGSRAPAKRARTVLLSRDRGGDCRVVLFDPATIIDRATYREPTLAPLGLRDVVVNGEIVVRDGAVKTGVFPGRGLRGPIQ